MKWFNRTVVYALVILHELAKIREERGEGDIARNRLTVVDLVNETKLPMAYTGKICSLLRDGHIISSHRGPVGGYALTRSPDRISMFQILAALGLLQSKPSRKTEGATRSHPTHGKQIAERLSQVVLNPLLTNLQNINLGQILNSGIAVASTT